MFGNRKRIKELEMEVSRLTFISNNPPKYKVGDKPNKDHIVTEAKTIEVWNHYTFYSPIFSGWTWKYTIINIKTGLKA